MVDTPAHASLRGLIRKPDTSSRDPSSAIIAGFTAEADISADEFRKPSIVDSKRWFSYPAFTKKTNTEGGVD
jgi:hypothetical protein